MNAYYTAGDKWEANNEFIITWYVIWNVDNIVHFGYDRGCRVESFEEGMVFLYENP